MVSSIKEAAFYGGNSPSTDNDLNAQELVREALNQLAQDPSINLADYDIEDEYDYDQDGDYREPDGVIDHLMVSIHPWVKKQVAAY